MNAHTEELYNIYPNDIKKPFYLSPTQVRFRQNLEDGEWTDDCWGIAYKDIIVCLHCGGVVIIDDEDLIIVEEQENWVSCEEELKTL